MKSDKNTPGSPTDHDSRREHGKAASPQQELLEKSRRNPNLGRKPAGKAHKPEDPAVKGRAATGTPKKKRS
jgi:hypothetical protein